MEAWMRVPCALLFATLLASATCDRWVGGRVKVVTVGGEPIPDALVQATKYDFARYTDAKGCADLSGTIGSEREVSITVGKSGYQSTTLGFDSGLENCLIVHLARAGEGTGSVEPLAPQACPCDRDAGYHPTLSARFKVTAADGAPVELVAVWRSGEPHYDWAQVTDPAGCLGISWVVSANLRSVPLVLEKDGYRAAQVEVPTMEDRCYAVNLARADAGQTSTVDAVDKDQCECEMFTGKTIWPEKK